MNILSEEIRNLIDHDSVQEIGKVTGAVVKTAACKLKAQKSDVSGWYTSDALLNAPDFLFEQLAIVSGAGWHMALSRHICWLAVFYHF